ncbi:LOW QUALITY PROTEIN: uncharacterized protein [Panulirus ornatus]|uniref:LOW QUALITY PROTEIN: uncharacterized protein n=1 Tax=Panulirus ornatus TaxID=150431 RepID=UPI003A882F55
MIFCTILFFSMCSQVNVYFFTGIGECELDSRVINPLILRRLQPSGTEVENELETPDSPRPGVETPEETEDKDEIESGVDAGGVKITKTTTKKVTNTTTIKKKTSKTTSGKEFSVSTERTSSSSGSSSSSSSSSSFSSSSSSGISKSDFDPSGYEEEGSGFHEEGAREHGRTHTRVSRRVYSSSGGSKFRINNIDNVGDEDGTVVSHHEETRTSFGVSPDNKTKFHETHHESRRVTVKEETTEEEIPRGRWSDGGGYRRTYTETSSSGVRTSDSVPEDDRFHWENHRTSQSGGGALDANFGSDTDELERSGSSDGYGRRLQGGGHSSIPANRGETIRTHSEGYGGSGNDHYRKTYNEETRIVDGDSRTQTTGDDTALDSEGIRRVHIYGGRTDTDNDRSSWPEESVGRGEWRTESGIHRVDNVNRAHPTRRTGEDDFTGTRTYESRGRFGNDFRHGDGGSDRRVSSGGQRTYTDGHDRTSGHVDGDSFTSDSGDYDYDRVTIDDKGRSHHEHDKNLDDNGYRKTIFDWNDRGSHTGHSLGHKRTEIIRTTESHGHRTDQDRKVQHSYNDRESFGDVDERTYTDDRSTAGEMNFRGQSNGVPRPQGNTFRADSDRYGNSMDSRMDSSKLRTTTWDLSSGRGGQNKAEWNTHSTHYQRNFDNLDNSQGHFDSTSSSSDRGVDLHESLVPDENGTYTRVEVDPETGKTTVYTRRVYSSWPENWDRRFYREEVSASSPQNEDEQTRQRRDLKRIKREKELIIKPQAVTDTQTGKTMQVVNLRCDGDFPTAKCFVFRCNIRNLGARQSASIRIKSRLWNSTLVEDYPRVSYVSIKSRASLILPEDIREDQDQSDDTASAETLAYPDLLDQLPPEEVPLWVILVSIFAGLLVLIIIVLILWKLGFFERKRPDPTLSGNLDKDANGY